MVNWLFLSLGLLDNKAAGSVRVFLYLNLLSYEVERVFWYMCFKLYQLITTHAVNNNYKKNKNRKNLQPLTFDPLFYFM